MLCYHNTKSENLTVHRMDHGSWFRMVMFCMHVCFSSLVIATFIIESLYKFLFFLLVSLLCVRFYMFLCFVAQLKSVHFINLIIWFIICDINVLALPLIYYRSIRVFDNNSVFIGATDSIWKFHFRCVLKFDAETSAPPKNLQTNTLLTRSLEFWLFIYI